MACIIERWWPHYKGFSYVFTAATGENGSEIDIGTLASNDFVDRIVIDNINITSKITPFYSGINNNFAVSLSNSDGNAPTNLKTIFLTFENKQAWLGPISAELIKAGAGMTTAAQGDILANQENGRLRL